MTWSKNVNQFARTNDNKWFQKHLFYYLNKKNPKRKTVLAGTKRIYLLRINNYL